jgi:hypothetical protein
MRTLGESPNQNDSKGAMRFWRKTGRILVMRLDFTAQAEACRGLIHAVDATGASKWRKSSWLR